ncbi:hypothetical protein EON66_07550 [archaeon]|nr:MAG: hypothetical protein EON66_07550 [archaeon]
MHGARQGGRSFHSRRLHEPLVFAHAQAPSSEGDATPEEDKLVVHLLNAYQLLSRFPFPKCVLLMRVHPHSMRSPRVASRGASLVLACARLVPCCTDLTRHMTMRTPL